MYKGKSYGFHKAYQPTINQRYQEMMNRKKKEFIKNLIGWIAVLLIIIAYFSITADLISSKDVSYNLLNLVGGILLAWRVYQDKNYSNLALEIAFIVIAIVALTKNI